MGRLHSSMRKLGLVMGLLSCIQLCNAQGPTFTSPNPDGSTVVTLDEGTATPIGTSVLLVTTAAATTSITLASVTRLSDGADVSADMTLVSGNQISTANLLDFETTAAYSITVDATDATGTTSASFVLQVNDVKDEPPVLPAGSNTFSLTWDEEQAAGSVVFPPFTVTDADAGDTHTFSLAGGHAVYFIINPSNGEIQAKNRLDRDASGAIITYNLDLTVTDAGGNTVTQALDVTLNDINDNAPVCSPPLYTTSLAENTAVDTIAATLTCTDIDASPNGDIASYTIVSGDDTSAKFKTVGAVVKTTAVVLDYETKISYTLLVDVVDNGATPKTGTATVLVLVTNKNDNDPAWGTFTPPGPTYSVQESVGTGTTLLTLTATDADAGVDGQLEYLLVSTTAGGSAVSNVFFVDAGTGGVVTMVPLDADAGVTPYTVVVRARDKGSPVRSVDQTLTINIVDENDNPPVFGATTYSAAISETNARAGVWAGLQLTATDADPTTGALLYQIAGGDALNKFQFSTTTAGLLELRTAIDVDKPSADPALYFIAVQASDQGVPGTPALTGTATVTITISPTTNDHTPAFGTPTPSAAPSVAENVPAGTIVATLPVTDNDMDQGVAQTVSFAITGGNTNSDFSIDPVLGVITTAKALDFETTQSYSLVVTATDSGTPALAATLTIPITVTNVNEYAPACTSYNMVASVAEETAAQPSQVATISCTDADTADTITYSIVPAQAAFTVDATTGVVSTITALDYEATTSYTLTIEAVDSLPTTLTSTVTLTVLVQPVNEFAPVFAPATYTAVLAENVAAGTSVTTVTATDNDKGALDGTIRYSIVSGNGIGAFTVNSDTGVISTTAAGLDRETDATHTLVVRARDDVPGAASEKSADTTVIVTVTDVNDNPPLCTPTDYQASVTEPSVVGATVVTLTANDDDEAGTPNSTPTFTVTAGDALAPGSFFGMSGADLVLAKVVDYETQTSYSLTITVKDGGNPVLSSTCKVQVTIISANEFPPVTTVPNFSMTLAETTAIGTTIYDVDATDNDVGTGSVITYNIISGNTNNDFFCYSTTGAVVVWNTLDFDVPPQNYNLTVEAADDGGLTDSLWLYVQLTDVNDQTPVFTQNVYSITVQENIANDTQVLVVTAVDTDTGADGTVTYTAVSGNGMSLFAVHASTGAVTTISNIDREVRRYYSIVIEASDGGTPSLSSTALVDIIISDVNDNAPVFTPSDFIVSISEDVAVGTSVTTLTAADADSAISNNVFSYVLVHTVFGVDAATGVLSTIKALDREKQAKYILTVLAPDSGATSLTGTATVTVFIDDVNDNAPVISGPNTPSVPEDAAVGTIVASINASDADTGDNARLTYVIVSGNTDGDFSITNVSGFIQVQNSLDRERTATYNLTVEVNDNGNVSLTATTSVVITVTDVNDNAPVWVNNAYSFSVTENAAAPKVVGQVAATDADKGVNAALTYSIVLFWSGNAAHFTIDGATGTISTTTPLDRESTAQYLAWLRVTDAGTPQLSTDTNVTIAVDDLNDNAPRFDQVSYSATATENDPVGTGLLTVTVTDDDIGVNADVTLSIDVSTAAGTRAAQFLEVTSATGVIAVKSVIDRETDASFNFTILATDGGTPAQVSSASVTVTVIDVNDNAPIFTQTYYNTEIAYTGQCTRSIVTVTATDADTGLNGQVTYFLQTSANDHLFQVDAVSGQFSLQSGITAQVMYTMTVSARDGGTPTLTALTPTTIRVDGMVPVDVAIVFKLGITKSAFLALQATFLQQLQVVMRQSYPTAVVRVWCVETNSNGLADVYVYFLRDDSTESVAGSNGAKYYVTQSEARGAFTSDPGGQPNAILSGSEWAPYDIRSVQPYTESQTPWAETAEGISVITACSLLGLMLLTAGTYMAVRYCRLAKRTRSLKRPVLVEERRQPARSNIQPEQNKPRPMAVDEEDFFWNRSGRQT